MILKARLIAPALLISLTTLGFAGCAENNESTATAGTKSSGTGDTPPPKNQQEYAKQRLQSGSGTTKASGYPGAK